MNFWRSLAGKLELTLHCADPSYALSLLENAGLTLEQVQLVDELTVRFTLSRSQYRALRRIADKRGFGVRLTARRGLFWYGPRLLKRPVLLIGLMLLALLGTFLPTRVLFIQVEGNSSVPARLILETAAQCGIGFGASRAEVRSEKMKNALLEQLPQLQWAGVNTAGCVAVISVRERQLAAAEEGAKGVASIVALRDGIVTSFTATKGNALCKAGQAVKAGQVLISGYTDCGFSIQAVRAEGEVYGKTDRVLKVIQPSSCEKRGAAGTVERKYSLIIGKKRINLYIGSGILDSSCVKIYEESYVTLPGGFQLPIALAVESWYSGELAEGEGAADALSEAARAYLLGEMTAGQILHAREEISQGDGLWLLSGRYACTELIGQLREEEIIKPDGTNDGENR